MAGFSLVETLIAVFILAMTSSAIILTLPQRSQTLVDDAEMLKAEIETAAMRAVLLGSPEGLRVHSSGIVREHVASGGWVVRRDAEIALSENTSITNVYRVPSARPDLIADATGMVTPAHFRLTREGQEVDVRVEENGRVTLEPGGE